MSGTNTRRRVTSAVIAVFVLLAALSTAGGDDARAAGTLLKPYPGQSAESHISDAAKIGAEALRVADVAAPREQRIWGSQSFAAAYPQIGHYQLGEPGQVSDNDYQEWAWEIANAIKYGNPNAKTYLANQPGATQWMNGWTSCGGPNGSPGSRTCFDGTVVGNTVSGPGYTIVQGPISTPTPIPTSTPIPTPTATANINADVSIVQVTSSASTVTVGEPLAYTIVVANGGPAQATNLTVIDDLAVGLTFDPARSPGCSISGRRVTCTVGTLAAGQSRAMAIGVTTALRGQFTNGAAVIPGQPDPNGSNNTAFAPLTTVNAPPCAPRPPVQSTVERTGDGRLRISIAAHPTAGAPNNRLERLTFERSPNALIGTGVNGQVSWNVATPYVIEDRSAVFTFFLSRIATNAPATLEMTVEDNCGPWRTFVGGGPAAFGP